ncbi:MAG: recombinase family protein [Oligoflexia bacterium]|nr:recombinase family protein [Oligoflexia bacterium]
MKTKRTAIYLRVSTSDQSTELQREELVKYVDARNWNLVGI